MHIGFPTCVRRPLEYISAFLQGSVANHSRLRRQETALLSVFALRLEKSIMNETIGIGRERQIRADREGGERRRALFAKREASNKSER